MARERSEMERCRRRGEEIKRKGRRYFYLDRKEFALVGKVWVIELDRGRVRSVRRGQRLSVAFRCSGVVLGPVAGFLVFGWGTWRQVAGARA